MTHHTRHGRRPSYFTGVITGLAIAGGAAFMMGAAQRAAQNQPQYEYFVTPSDQQASGARLWRRPLDKDSLEFVGSFSAVQRGR